MKKISIAVLLFLTVIGTTFANGHEGTPAFKGAKSFIASFPGATNVEYKSTGQFTKVEFTWKELKLEAFYDKEGILLATGRQIPFENLPLSVQLNMNKEYSGFFPTQVSEFNDANDGLCYYVTVTSPERSYILHVSPNGSIDVFKKMKN
jgi:hypothetical protein